MSPRLIPHDRSYEIHAFNGKNDLLRKLADRLRGYAQWLPTGWRIIVLVDRDDEDCRTLKARLDTIAQNCGLLTDPTQPTWQLINRIVIKEPEAWHFGNWPAVHAAYLRVPASVSEKQPFRDPDRIVGGGTWEAFERILQRYGYFKAGLAKIEAVRAIAAHIDPSANRSPSFAKFMSAINQAMR